MTEHCRDCGTYLPCDHGHDLCDTCLRAEVERLRAALVEERAEVLGWRYIWEQRGKQRDACVADARAALIAEGLLPPA